MAVNLFHFNDERAWKIILEQYKKVLRKKSELPGKEELVQLDEWYQNILPGCIASRNPRYINRDELLRIMKWKIMRGKFRPRLEKLIQQNSEADIYSISVKSFKQIEDITSAIREMCKLKAVGPATASAILCAVNPDVFPFMADEAMAPFPALKIDYSVRNYVAFQERLRMKANELNEDGEMHWTPHKIELALWTDVTAMKLGISLDFPHEQYRQGKRKNDEKTSENTEDDSTGSNKKLKKMT